MSVKAVLFDLDGTLLDTAPDLGYALNVLLQENGMAALSLAEIRTVASHGSLGLLKLGFGINETHAAYPKLRDKLLHIYAQHLTRETSLFQGMDAVLKHMEDQHILWGVVTNKPGFLTNPLLQQLQLTQRAACVISGDTLAVSKPNPEPLWHACDIIKVSPQQTIYLGDAERDIEAGKRAGMRTLIAAYGYIATEDKPETWQADGMLYQPNELLNWI